LWDDRSFLNVASQKVWGRAAGLFQSRRGIAVRILWHRTTHPFSQVAKQHQMPFLDNRHARWWFSYLPYFTWSHWLIKERRESTDKRTTQVIYLLTFQSRSNALSTVTWCVLMSRVLQSMHCTISIKWCRIEQRKSCVKRQQEWAVTNTPKYNTHMHTVMLMTTFLLHLD